MAEIASSLALNAAITRFSSREGGHGEYIKRANDTEKVENPRFGAERLIDQSVSGGLIHQQRTCSSAAGLFLSSGLASNHWCFPVPYIHYRT